MVDFHLGKVSCGIQGCGELASFTDDLFVIVQRPLYAALESLTILDDVSASGDRKLSPKNKSFAEERPADAELKQLPEMAE
ncbi:MAG: hypothetical protein GY768_16910 [Planctomycetaceae bacterium]|nr:hypothetical protein [Planctomycetaceae bacterium]